MIIIQLNTRQLKIIEIVKENEPITSEHIASILSVTRATLRSDLAILTMTGILDARPKVGYFYSGVNENNLLNKKLTDKKVKDIMSLPVVVKKDTTVYDVIVSMFLSDVGTIFITNEKNELCGVVSRKDLLKNTIGGSDINKIPVGLIMTRMPNVVTAKPEDSVIGASKKIIEHEIDSLPVVETVNEDGIEVTRIIGRISKTNITKLLVELASN
ncbi:MAG TPA: helix-turn-helix transcriptional regulator [Peptostreptococcaceae bacterium]|nr:helix-turn-helix transcriptional regulator [Peptostreptococcaceae bacterium]